MKAGIAGAGLVGRLLAFALIKAGWEVTLFDSDDQKGLASCGMVAAGMLALMAELEHAEPMIYELGQESLVEWPKLIKQLTLPVYYQQKGSLVVAHASDQADLTRYLNVIIHKVSNTAYKKLNAEQLMVLEPELTKFSGGYYFPEEGQIDNQQLFVALAHEILAANAVWHSNTLVLDLKPGKIILANSTVEFDMVFDCRGLGAKAAWRDLRGVRGELLWLHAPAVEITRPVRLLHPRYNLYIAPRPDHIYIVGASEIESEDNSSISVRSTLELLSAAYSIHAGFLEARVIKSAVNCRPAFFDNLPRVDYVDGLIRINGLYRHGFLIAPALIKQVMQRLPQVILELHRDNYYIK